MMSSSSSSDIEAPSPSAGRVEPKATLPSACVVISSILLWSLIVAVASTYVSLGVWKIQYNWLEDESNEAELNGALMLICIFLAVPVADIIMHTIITYMSMWKLPQLKHGMRQPATPAHFLGRLPELFFLLFVATVRFPLYFAAASIGDVVAFSVLGPLLSGVFFMGFGLFTGICMGCCQDE